MKNNPSLKAGATFLFVITLNACRSESEVDFAALCATDDTKSGIKELILSDFRKDFTGELRFANDVASQLTFDLQKPVATNVDPAIRRTDCEARAVLTVSPAMREQFDRENELIADIGYSVQETADKAEKLYRASGYDAMIPLLLAGADKLQAEAGKKGENEQEVATAPSTATETGPQKESASPSLSEADIAKTCFALWKERNSIFAEAGYCFKSQKAIDAFGKRCYPPYGKLSKEEQDIVSKLRAQERQYNCNG